MECAVPEQLRNGDGHDQARQLTRAGDAPAFIFPSSRRSRMRIQSLPPDVGPAKGASDARTDRDPARPRVSVPQRVSDGLVTPRALLPRC
jgi:hypothetical protein